MTDPRTASTDVDPAPAAAFVREHLPRPPATVLEVGAGGGGLAEELAAAGYEITAIDPRPRGSRVRRVTLERFEPERPFDAVIALRTLHHVDDVGPVVARIGQVLRPTGLVVVQGYAWDRLDLSTTTWIHAEKTRLGHGVPRDPVIFYERWRHEHKDLVPSEQVIAALDNVFQRTHFSWIPYLAGEYLDDDVESRRRERAAIIDGRVRPAGFRFVGASPAHAGAG